MDERDWARLVEQLADGDCTPFLGAGACAGILPTASALSRAWAPDHDYPFEDHEDLAAVMQYVTVAVRDPVTVKQRLADKISQLTRTSAPQLPEVHALLAKLPLPVFLTTNYDDLMLHALRWAGRRPTVAVCPWHESEMGRRTTVPKAFEPTADEPLIYHLHGSLDDAPSMVVTEQDYLQFLTRLVMERAMNDHRLIPPQVLDALTRRPLLFLGYSFRDWSFKVLFHGLVQSLPRVMRRRHVSVQLLPRTGADDDERRRRAEEYLRRYYDGLDVSVYLGTVSEFTSELRHRLGFV